MNKHVPISEAEKDDLHIRIATTDDMAEVMALALSATEENALVEPDPGKMATFIWSALSLDNGLMGAIGRPGGPIEGVILMTIGEMWYSKVPLLEERAIFIKEDCRSAKGGRAKRLSDFAKQAADTLELPLLIGVLSSARSEGKTRLYRRQFGEPAGAFFIYGTKTGSWKYNQEEIK